MPPQIEKNKLTFLQYGITTEFSDILVSKQLTVSSSRSTSLTALSSKYGLTTEQAKLLKECVNRQPIEKDILHLLLESSNYTCVVCKGIKGTAFVVHHIEPYAKSQNNNYYNLVVLCPNDHDSAHNSGLSMGITPKELLKLKGKWETQVEEVNAARAARNIDIYEGTTDYINIFRIEELCLQLFGKIPITTVTHFLQSKGIIDENGIFQKKYVKDNLSNGKYLFDYINSGESIHYQELLKMISKEIYFADLSSSVDSGIEEVKKLEGQHAFFIGGVYSKRPKFPITSETPTVLMHYKKRKIKVEWILDPDFFQSMSAISRQGVKNRYIIYCLVRTINVKKFTGTVQVVCSPYLIAQPSKYKHKIPLIKYQRQNNDY